MEEIVSVLKKIPRFALDLPPQSTQAFPEMLRKVITSLRRLTDCPKTLPLTTYHRCGGLTFWTWNLATDLTIQSVVTGTVCKNTGHRGWLGKNKLEAFFITMMPITSTISSRLRMIDEYLPWIGLPSVIRMYKSVCDHCSLLFILGKVPPHPPFPFSPP